MKKTLLVLTLFCGFFATAQIVNIPDTNFKNALLNHDPVIDTNDDGEIQVSEAEALIANLNLFDKSISDLTGIEAFINIERLHCHENLLTQLDLSANVNLEYLNCSSNQLTTLDVTDNLLLEYLNAGENILNDLNVSPHNNLEYLNCSDNELNILDVSQIPNLNDLFFAGTNITSIDISSNINLKNLEFHYTPISNIDLTNNINLEYITSDYCPLTSLDISNNPNLKSLVSRSSNLTALDVTNNPDLELLVVYNNNISHLDVTHNPILAQLLCYNNNLSSLDVTQNLNLEWLWFGGNDISEIDVSQNPMLDWIDYHSGPLTSIDLSTSFNLKDLRLSNTQLSEINLSNNLNLCLLEMDNNFILEYINLKNGNDEVFGGGCSSTSLSIQNNPNLQFICVEDAVFAAANFTDIPPLTTFVEDCSLANSDLNIIEGTLTFDDESNGCDGGDAGIENLLINTTDGTNNFATLSSENGFYNLYVAENTYTTTVVGLSPYFSLTPAEAVDTFVGFNQTETANFCIAPTTTANDLSITFVPLSAAGPGFEATYQIVYENVGTTQLSGEVVLEFEDAFVTFVEAVPEQTSQSGNTLTWDYTNLNPFESGSINLTFTVAPPPIVESGDVLHYIATANPVAGDETPDDNVFQLNQEVVNSFDPNDKTVLEGWQVLIEDADEYLHYIVRFQNMGTASAINVRVQDLLDEKLDWTTLRVLEMSHDGRVEITNGLVDFVFDDINLPTEASDPEGSQGFVAFKIKPLPGIVLGDTVENSADIYFDFNAAIVTNTVSTTYVDELGIDDFQASKIILYPNPANDVLNIEAETNISSIEITNMLGQALISTKENGNKHQVNISGLSAGNYFVKVTTGNTNRVLRLIKK